MLGCTAAEASPAKPNAHFTFSRGTSFGVSPAAAPRWKRSLASDRPHPFHCGAFVAAGAALVAHMRSGGGAGVSPTALPVRKAAIARRSPGVRSAPCVRIVPDSRAATIRSGARPLNTWRVGVRGRPRS